MTTTFPSALIYKVHYYKYIEKTNEDVSKTKRNYLIQTAVLTFLLGIVGGWIYFNTNPHHYFNGYPLIPSYFFLFGWLMINIVEWSRKKMTGKLLQIYMLLRVMRMLASFILMVLYCVIVREEAQAFLLTFIANYLIYLTYDSWFFFTFEVNKKSQKENKR